MFITDIIKVNLCTLCLFRLLPHLSVRAVPLILQVVQIPAQLGNDLDVLGELDDLFLKVRGHLRPLLQLPLQAGSLLFQPLYLLFQIFHLFLVVLPLDLNVVLRDSEKKEVAKRQDKLRNVM